jgi:NAD(P)-dependent dehydrogenase (short-subunit alcohol dehydrogenase family)
MHASVQRLTSKVVLITGAARGIGLACARRCLAEGARVVLTDLNPAVHAGASGLATEFAATSRVHSLILDVRDESHWHRALAETLARFGALHVLINNAGITGFPPDSPDMGPHDPERASLAAWRAVHATNLDGVFLGCKHAIAAMKPPAGSGGSIINISSRSGLVGIPAAAAYASSKAGVRNHTKSVALWCAQQRYNIRCNSIHPGAILTPMWEPMLGEGSQREAAIAEIASTVPLGRMGSPDDVAALAAFLASDDASYMTGSELTLDGGILAGADAQPKRQ